mmetsp:Transcript_19290/g.61100  ORF Transcript_19290/g.61100 Transcript_19290/m.61100 type:complete len:207 (-) Transcript_19290:173-793(-)
MVPVADGLGTVATLRVEELLLDVVHHGVEGLHHFHGPGLIEAFREVLGELLVVGVELWESVGAVARPVRTVAVEHTCASTLDPEGAQLGQVAVVVWGRPGHPAHFVQIGRVREQAGRGRAVLATFEEGLALLVPVELLVRLRLGPRARVRSHAQDRVSNSHGHVEGHVHKARLAHALGDCDLGSDDGLLVARLRAWLPPEGGVGAP